MVEKNKYWGYLISAGLILGLILRGDSAVTPIAVMKVLASGGYQRFEPEDSGPQRGEWKCGAEAGLTINTLLLDDEKLKINNATEMAPDWELVKAYLEYLEDQVFEGRLGGWPIEANKAKGMSVCINGEGDELPPWAIENGAATRDAQTVINNPESPEDLNQKLLIEICQLQVRADLQEEICNGLGLAVMAAERGLSYQDYVAKISKLSSNGIPAWVAGPELYESLRVMVSEVEP